jgi:hypothetical protein
LYCFSGEKSNIASIMTSMHARLPTQDSHIHGQAGSLDLDRSIALVGGDNLSSLDLLVGVGGPDDEPLLLVDNGESGEALVGTELAAPARGDSCEISS